MKKKLEFLHSILSKNDSMRNQFIEYCKPVEQTGKNPGEDEKISDRIASACNKLTDDLESLDFEEMDWRNYNPRHGGYIEDYEAYEYFAEDHLDVVFNTWKEKILLSINNGQIVTAVCACLGTYNACLSASINGSDDIFEDMTDTLLQKHKELLDGLITVFETTVKSDEQALQATSSVIDHYLSRYQGMKNYLKYFESLLISLIENKKTADHLIEKLLTSGIDESWLPKLTVKLFTFKEGNKAWIHKAEKFLYDDLDVARQLLTYYWIHDVISFMGHGKRLFQLHPDELCDFFRERLYPLLDREFFRDVLWHKTMRERDMELYKELRDFLDEEEKQRFIDGITYEIPFRVKVLEIEKKFEEILMLAKKDVEHTWHFTELITPVLNIYPDEVLELIRLKISFELTQSKKRSTYTRISNYLNLATRIAHKEAETRLLIHEIYNRKPALPALKDEMRKAGVVE